MRRETKRNQSKEIWRVSVHNKTQDNAMKMTADELSSHKMKWNEDVNNAKSRQNRFFKRAELPANKQSAKYLQAVSEHPKQPLDSGNSRINTALLLRQYMLRIMTDSLAAIQTCQNSLSCAA